MGLLFLLFVALCGASTYMDEENVGRKTCHKSQSQQWGAHNVLPNLYEYVYQPFLDLFTYTAMCRHPYDALVTCMDFPQDGPFEQRCAKIGVTSMWHYYTLILQYATGTRMEWDALFWKHSHALQVTLNTTSECDILVRRAEAAFHPRRECPRAALAYQCVWNNVAWVVLPLMAVISVTSITLLSLCFSFCMLGSESY